MYDSPSVIHNLKKVQQYGYHILEPESGFLASGLEGKGRLPEFEAILKKSSKIIGDIEGPLAGKKVLVTAGPTREYIDPVRFISNPSSGKMGVAMANAAVRLGAEVTFIHGPITTEFPTNTVTKSIISAQDLFNEVKRYAHFDVIIMTAAVSDFTPGQVHPHKVKKQAGSNSIQLKNTVDILSWLGKHKRDHQTLIGFAMETEHLLYNATRKLNAKNADWIVANLLKTKGSGFQSDSNHVYLIGKNSQTEFSGLKYEVAEQVLNFIFRQ